MLRMLSLIILILFFVITIFSISYDVHLLINGKEPSFSSIGEFWFALSPTSLQISEAVVSRYFDPCSLFPNKEVATDGTIVEKAKKIETPNTNPKKPEESAATVKTTTEFTNEQPQAKPSVISPSGLTYSEVEKKWTELEEKIYAMTDVYWKGLNEGAVKAHADYIKANPGPRSEILDIESRTGRKAQSLYVNGVLSETAAKYYEKEQLLSDIIDIIDQRSVVFYEVESEYLYYLVGEVTQYEWDEVVRKYSSEEIYEDDYFKWVQIQNQWDKGKQTVVDWFLYQNVNNQSGTTAQ